MTDMPEMIWAKCDEVHGAIQVGGWADTIRQCPDGVAYRRADLPPQVKPLVWSIDGFPRAVTILGDYVILEWRRGPQLTFNRGATQITVMDCDSTEHAKAAAQADYTARIIAALVTP